MLESSWDHLDLPAIRISQNTGLEWSEIWQLIEAGCIDPPFPVMDDKVLAEIG